MKTVTTSSHVLFNKGTLGDVDRVMILRIEIDEGEASIVEVYDGTRNDMITKSKDVGAQYQYVLKKQVAAKRPLSDLKATASAHLGDRMIRQLENGTIVVEIGGVAQPVVKPLLREICEEIGVGLLNANGNRKNIRQLGAAVIASLNA